AARHTKVHVEAELLHRFLGKAKLRFVSALPVVYWVNEKAKHQRNRLGNEGDLDHSPDCNCAVEHASENWRVRRNDRADRTREYGCRRHDCLAWLLNQPSPEAPVEPAVDTE